MTPDFPLLRKLYTRLLSKPEELISLDRYKSKSISCGTPHCVLGELVEMPEGQALGLEWKWVPGDLGD